MAEKLYTTQIIDAVGASSLPSELRFLLVAMAHLATGSTGIGWSSQETIARFIGCSARQVRSNLQRLAVAHDSPVQVERRYRTRREGRGRTSDEYRLVLAEPRPAPTPPGPPSGGSLPVEREPVPATNRKPASAESEPPTGSPLPVEKPQPVATNRKSSDDQPEVQRATNRKPTSGDQLRDQLRDQRSEEKAATSAAPWQLQPVDGRGQQECAQPKKRSVPKPEHTEEQRRAQQRITGHYFTEFERLRGAKPVGWGAKEGKAVYDLLEKCQGDEVQICELITNGLGGWNKATIMWIASNPSACVAGSSSSNGGSQGMRAGDLLGRQMQRVAALEASERAGKALL